MALHRLVVKHPDTGLAVKNLDTGLAVKERIVHVVSFRPKKLHTDTLPESFPMHACSLSSPFALTTAPCTLSASCSIWFAECLVCRVNASLSLSSCSAATLFLSWVYRGIGLYVSGSFRLVLPKVSPYLHHCVCLCATGFLALPSPEWASMSVSCARTS